MYTCIYLFKSRGWKDPPRDEEDEPVGSHDMLHVLGDGFDLRRARDIPLLGAPGGGMTYAG
jgi:hypothetical protein